VVLLGVLVYLFLQRSSSVQVVSVAVRNSAAAQGCHSTARIVGTLRTSGGAGTVHYRWHRSDGTVSDELTQHVVRVTAAPTSSSCGPSTVPAPSSATATLEVLGRIRVPRRPLPVPLRLTAPGRCPQSPDGLS